MKKDYSLVFGMLLLALTFSSTFVLAAELAGETEPQAFGIGIDELINIGSSLLATILFILTFIAYKRDGRKKLLYVGVAFLLFAIKGFLIASDIIFPGKGGWIDPTAHFLDFAILLSFFFGLLKKGG